MSDTVDVDPDVLRDHASSVRGFLGQVTAATANAGQTLDINTFGLACVAPAQILQIWIRDADRFIKQAVTAGNEVADAIGEMAESYRLNEAAQDRAFRRIHTTLDGDS